MSDPLDKCYFGPWDTYADPKVDVEAAARAFRDLHDAGRRRKYAAVHHLCGNLGCVNPRHLKVVDIRENRK